MKEVDIRLKIINKSLNSVDRKISNVIGSLSGKETFSDIVLLVKDAFKDLAKSEKTINNYNDLSKRVKGDFSKVGLNILYDASDVSLINDISKANQLIMSSIRSEYESRISSIIYTSSLSEVDPSLLSEQIAALIIASDKVVGRSIQSVLETEVETFVMDTDATIMLKKGKEAGIKKYIYIGSLIKDSREWCVNHVNKTFSEKEIQLWEKSNWKGKKAGNPFIVRGGWRCRHHFAPTVGT